MSWQVFFTAFALLAMALSAYYAWLALDRARRAEHSEHRLAIMRGQVAGLEASVEALNTKHNKLAGRVYADEYWRGKNEQQPELEPANSNCENWIIAQRDGPSSPAAGCECSYCNAKREDRARRRASMRSGVKT